MNVDRYRKAIPLMKLIQFCENYNAIGYGKAKICELKNKFIVELYNAGYSENEVLDSDFKRKYTSCIILDRHPITIAEFSKLDLHYGTHIVDFENVSKKDYDFIYERDIFRHMLEIQ